MFRMIPVAVLLSAATSIGATITGKVHCRPLETNADVVVFIAHFQDHPDMEFTPPAEAVVMDQRRLTFVPHVLPVLRGTRVAFRNGDEVRHSVLSPSKARRFNLGIYSQGGVRYVVFDQPGEVALLCNVHAEMSAYVIVTETPFFAVTDEQGRFEIEDVPPGRCLLKTWHEKLASVSREINVEGPSLNIEIELKEWK